MPVRAARGGSFSRGLVLGLFLGISLSWAGLFLFAVRGVTVHVPAAPMAQSLSARAQAHLEGTLPAVMGAARSRIPDLVRPELHRRLTAARIEFYGVSITVPPDALGGLENYLIGVVEQTVSQLLEGMTTQWVRGEEQGALTGFLQEALQRDLNGQTVRVKLAGPFTLPVTVIVE